MAQHFTKNTEAITKWCNRCGRLTLHSVSAGRLGRCENEHPSKADQEKARRQAEDVAPAPEQKRLF